MKCKFCDNILDHKDENGICIECLKTILYAGLLGVEAGEDDLIQ